MLYLINIFTFITMFIFTISLFQILKNFNNQNNGELKNENFNTKGKYLVKLILRLVRLFTPINKRICYGGYKDKISKKLISAGSPYRINPVDFIGLKELSICFFCIVALIFIEKFDLSKTYIFIALPGFYFPDLWIKEITKKRQNVILKILPNYLDILTLAVEAGLDLSIAISKVAEMGDLNPLKEEFSLVMKEIKMGKIRREALSDMSERINLPAISTFVMAINNADKMGTGIGKVLRIQSEQIRNQRFQKAEKLANEAPIKLLLPLLGFIFPAVFIIMFSPIILKILKSGIIGN